MDENEKSDKITHGYWLVAFIDLLGQKDAFLKADFLPAAHDLEKVEAFTKAVKASIGVVHAMRRILETFRAALATTTVDENSPLLGMTAEQIARIEEMKARRVRERRWSDGVLLACPLKPEAGHSPIMAVYEILCTCGALMLVQLAMGRPIRGGLDVGIAAEVDGELFGAALVKAYQNESERAQHPRLVVGKELVNYLDTMSHNPAPIERGLAQGLRDLLLENFDGDGEWILDYAGPGMRAIMPDATGFLAPASAFARRSRSEFQACGERGEKLSERYAKVIRYLDARASLAVLSRSR